LGKKIIFLADSISTQRAGIHYYGKQLIHKIISQYPQHDYSLVASEKIEEFDFDQHIIPIKRGIPQHLRIRQLTSIPKKVNSLEADIVIELAHFGPFGLSEKTKKVTVIHDLSPISHPQHHGIPSQMVQKTSLPKIIDNADHIITNSAFTKKEIINHYQKDENTIDVVYPDLNQPDSTTDLGVLQNRYHINQPYFIVSGTIEPRKNHITILKAFEHFQKSGIPMQLVIAGQTGWKNSSFFKALKKIKRKDRIILTGYVSREDLWGLYRYALAFISASHFEGFGIPIIEAMSNHLSLIIADNSSQKEVVGDSALLFQAEDITLLSKHMDAVSSDESLRKELVIKGDHRLEQISQQKFSLAYLD